MPISTPAQLVLIDGPEAVAFAQTQFSSNVSTLSDGQWQFSAWLDAQGRVRALFHLARSSEDKLILLLRGGQAEHMANELRRFVFRTRVTIHARSADVIVKGPPAPTFQFNETKTQMQFGCETHSLQIGEAHEHNDKDDSWQALQLSDGWPWLPEQALNEILPPALSLHRLGAVAIDKGCYPGQEIVARMHYRNGHKRHLHRIGLSQHVADGAVLRRNDREFVRLLDVLSHADHTEALAVIADDIANNIAQRMENTSDDGVVIVMRQTWPD